MKCVLAVLKKPRTILVLGVLFHSLFCSKILFANNLDISNVQIDGQSATANTLSIQFGISWENSWRDAVNYDAAWVFTKYSTNGGLTWHHATMKASGENPGGFSVGTGTALEIEVPSDKKGCFIRRNGGGNGTVSATALKIVWDYGYDGLSDEAVNSQNTLIKVIAIEMVYVPTGSFYIGDGNGATESVYALHVTDNTTAQITTNPLADVTVDINASDDIDTAPVTVDGDGGVTGNSSWPTGFEAFYMMKYEITEGQWVEFFNTLSTAEKATRDITSATGKNSDAEVYRNTVSWSSGHSQTERSDRACGFLSWMDICAYADWASLRPMTELEFEKASRGSESAVLEEFAWGNTSAVSAQAIIGSEYGSEFVGTPGANAHFGNISLTGGDGSQGPVRAGIFATGSSSRIQSGAGYFGSLDFSGNLTEQCVSLGSAVGRLFVGSNGDGELSQVSGYEGNATNLDWPGIDAVNSRGITGAMGAGFRGGAWSDLEAVLGTSNRSSAALTDVTRNPSNGGRVARTAS